jgi:hypothetical protein
MNPGSVCVLLVPLRFNLSRIRTTVRVLSNSRRYGSLSDYFIAYFIQDGSELPFGSVPNSVNHFEPFPI